MTIRPPAIAGTFYPAGAKELRDQITRFFADAESEHGGEPAPKAIIAPHAGTIYSGPVAASAYVRLRAARSSIRRVVLLGPAHRVALRGLAVSSADAFRTPLGDVRVDIEARNRALSLPGVSLSDEAHRQEHALEIHLPFLQMALNDFVCLPLVVGMADAASVSRVLDAFWGGDETLVVVSSDLSHFHPYAEARVLDQATSRRFEQLQYEGLTGDDACGVYPVSGLLHNARRRGMTLHTIDLRNSGDTAGPRDEVVGYGCYVLH